MLVSNRMSYLFCLESVSGWGLSLWMELWVDNAWPFKLDIKAAQCLFVAVIIEGTLVRKALIRPCLIELEAERQETWASWGHNDLVSEYSDN